MTPRSISRLASFGHALRGLRVLLRQPNARIHAVVACSVVALGIWLQISASDWLAVVLAMGLPGGKVRGASLSRSEKDGDGSLGSRGGRGGGFPTPAMNLHETGFLCILRFA